MPFVSCLPVQMVQTVHRLQNRTANRKSERKKEVENLRNEEKKKVKVWQPHFGPNDLHCNWRIELKFWIFIMDKSYDWLWCLNWKFIRCQSRMDSPASQIILKFRLCDQSTDQIFQSLTNFTFFSWLFSLFIFSKFIFQETEAHDKTQEMISANA